MFTPKINLKLYLNDEEEINKILADLSVPIIELGLPSTIFTAKEAWKAFYRSKPYMKLVKSTSYYAKMGVLEDALNIGITKGLISSPQECTATQYGKWARWLNTKEGQQIIQNAQRTKKMKKRAARDETLQQANYDKKGEKKVCHLLGISGKEAVDDAIGAAKETRNKRSREE